MESMVKSNIFCVLLICYVDIKGCYKLLFVKYIGDVMCMSW